MPYSCPCFRMTDSSPKHQVKYYFLLAYILVGKFSWQPTSLDKSHEADDVCKLTTVEASLVTIRIQKVSTSGVELAALAVNSLFDERKKQSRILSSTVHNFDRAINSCNIYIYSLWKNLFLRINQPTHNKIRPFQEPPPQEKSHQIRLKPRPNWSLLGF